jgi:prolyl-tRNA synthetase
MAEEKTTFNIDKQNKFAEWYDRILVEADIMDKRYPIKGMPIFTKYGYHMHCAIMEILEQEWTKQNIDKVQFPVLIPESYLTKEASHLEGFSAEVFWATEGGDKKLEVKCALRPTSETAMYSMFSLWVRSFRDLPLKVHQTCSVYRYETKDTLPLIRAREIHWNEAHTCHATEQDAIDNLEAAWKSYLYLLNDRLGVYGIRLRRPEWDKFAGAVHTDVLDCVLPSGKVLQTVGAHYLGQIFSSSFDIKFLNERNEHEFSYMTCYGVSTRVLACALSSHGDDKGLILPSAIAKWKVVITPLIFKGKGAAVIEAGKVWKKVLDDAGISVVLDDSDKAPGEKYYFWEMKGVPLRLEIGPKDLEKDQVCLVRRDGAGKTFVASNLAIETIREVLITQDASLNAKSKAYAASKVVTCMTLDEAAHVLKSNGGFVRIPFFSTGLDGGEGEKIIHERCNAEVRGFMPGETIDVGLKCAATGKPAVVWAYCAKSY